MEKKNKDNIVHIHGFINGVSSFDAPSGDTVFSIDVATKEAWKKNENDKEYEEKVTYHNVSLSTKDKKVISELNSIAADIAANIENKDKKGYKAVYHEASFDGSLVTRERVYNGVEYNKQFIVASAEGMRIGKLEDKEVRNFAEITGTISKIDMKDNFAIISVASHFFAPGKGVNYKGEEKEYQEKTNFVETRLSENFRKEAFGKIKNGEIEVGDLISVRGQMHNNSYTDKNGVNRRKTVIDLNTVELIAKKGQKKAAGEKKEVEKKAAPAKKATSRKKTQRSM